MLRRPAFIAALVALLTYAVTLGGTLIYDDVALVGDDKRLRSVRAWAGFFTQSYNGGIDNLYRPMTSMSYALQYAVGGSTAWPYHLVNLLLHAAICALVAMIGFRLMQRSGANERRARTVAMLAGVLFAVHPIHVEAVANIVGRAELLCAIGSLGALLIALGDTWTNRHAVIGWLLFVLAVFSKEQAMVMPLVGVVVVWVTGRFSAAASGDPLPSTYSGQAPSPLPAYRARVRDNASARIQLDYKSAEVRTPAGSPRSLMFALVAVTLAAYVILREQVLGLKFWWDRSFLDRWVQPMADSAGWDRALVPVSIAGHYLALLVAPIHLGLDYGGPIVPGVARWNDPYLWLGFGAIGLWTVWLLIAWRRRDGVSIAMLLSFAIVYGAIGNLVTLIGVNMAERLMYLPSVFLAVLVAHTVAALMARWRGMIVLVAIVLACYAVRTVSYAARWNNRAAFYEYLLAVEPRSMKAALLNVQESLERKETARAVVFARKAVDIQPSYEQALVWLARAQIADGQFDEAERTLQRQLTLNPIGGAQTQIEKLHARRAAMTQPSTERTTQPPER